MLSSAISGLATGTLLGLLGGGGSILAVPILIYVLGVEAKSAIGTSLVIVGAASLLAAWSHYRHRSVVVSTALVVGATGVLGSYAGGQVAQLIPDAVQMTMFALVMALIALLMLRHGQPKTQTPDADGTVALPVGLLTGLGAGVLTGLLGVGGGFILVPALTMLLHMPIKNAIGTSLLVIGINCVVGAISYSSHLSLSGPLLPFAVGTLAAAPAAARISQLIPQDRLKVGFAVSLLLLAAWILTRQFQS